MTNVLLGRPRTDDARDPPIGEMATQGTARARVNFNVVSAESREVNEGALDDADTAIDTAPMVRIYRPARNASQSGRAGAKHWVLEFEPSEKPDIEPLMGWTRTQDTRQQVRLQFPNLESALTFAKREKFRVGVTHPHDPILRPKSYAEKFRQLSFCSTKECSTTGR